MPERNAFDGRRVHVLAENCPTCIFRPGNLMHLAPGRVKRMITEAVLTDSAIICHSTLNLDQQAVCRGFFDSYRTTPLLMADRLGLIVEDGVSAR